MKRILPTAALLLALLTLAACGGGEDIDDASHAVMPVNCQATPSPCR